MSRGLTSTNDSDSPSRSSIPAGPRSSIERRSLTRPPPDLDAFLAVVDLLEAHPHVLGDLGREVLPDEVGPDRELAMAPVHEHGQLHGPGTTELRDRLEGGARGPAREQDVVDEDHDPVGDVDGDLGRAQGLDPPEADVVAVEGDVDRPDGDVDALEPLDRLGEAVGDGDAPRVQPDEHHVARSVVPLDDLVRDAGVGAAEVVGVEDLRLQRKQMAPGGGRVARASVVVVAGQGSPAGDGRRHASSSSVGTSRDPLHGPDERSSPAERGRAQCYVGASMVTRLACCPTSTKPMRRYAGAPMGDATSAVTSPPSSSPAAVAARVTASPSPRRIARCTVPTHAMYETTRSTRAEAVATGPSAAYAITTAVWGASVVRGVRHAVATSPGMPYTEYASEHTAAASATCSGVATRSMCTSSGTSAGGIRPSSTMSGAGSPKANIPAASAASMTSSSRPTSPYTPKPRLRARKKSRARLNTSPGATSGSSRIAPLTSTGRGCGPAYRNTPPSSATAPPGSRVDAARKKSMWLVWASSARGSSVMRQPKRVSTRSFSNHVSQPYTACAAAEGSDGSIASDSASSVTPSRVPSARRASFTTPSHASTSSGASSPSARPRFVTARSSGVVMRSSAASRDCRSSGRTSSCHSRSALSSVGSR